MHFNIHVNTHVHMLSCLYAHKDPLPALIPKLEHPARVSPLFLLSDPDTDHYLWWSEFFFSIKCGSVYSGANNKHLSLIKTHIINIPAACPLYIHDYKPPVFYIFTLFISDSISENQTQSSYPLMSYKLHTYYTNGQGYISKP